MQAMAADWMAAQGVPDLVIANAGVAGGFDTARGRRSGRDAPHAGDQSAGRGHHVPALSCPHDSGHAATPGRRALVGVASLAGWRGMPGNGAYCASKAGLIAYLQSLRAELRASGAARCTRSAPAICAPRSPPATALPCRACWSPMRRARLLLRGWRAARSTSCCRAAWAGCRAPWACCPTRWHDRMLLGPAAQTPPGRTGRHRHSRPEPRAPQAEQPMTTPTTEQQIALIGAGPSGLAGGAQPAEARHSLPGLRGLHRRGRAVEHRQPAHHGLRIGAPDLQQAHDRVHRVPDGRRGGRLPQPPRADALLRPLRRSLRAARALPLQRAGAEDRAPERRRQPPVARDQWRDAEGLDQWPTTRAW